MLRLYNWIFIPVNNTSPLVRQLPLFYLQGLAHIILEIQNT